MVVGADQGGNTLTNVAFHTDSVDCSFTPGLEEKLEELMSALKHNDSDEWPGKPCDNEVDLLAIMTAAKQETPMDPTNT
ncbi:unnamed protein product [Phytomonas sp. EM1]|nr:unnamed protein product [Phytomonas sp. EM1]|eukprot:CCW64021.1 unnamed protein product [Phytomonas sp. isolate EM1]